MRIIHEQNWEMFRLNLATDFLRIYATFIKPCQAVGTDLCCLSVKLGENQILWKGFKLNNIISKKKESNFTTKKASHVIKVIFHLTFFLIQIS